MDDEFKLGSLYSAFREMITADNKESALKKEEEEKNG